ncbi:hypothetical protein JNUCC0626_18380 [Lentzea sp. JNUCC 0626]
MSISTALSLEDLDETYPMDFDQLDELETVRAERAREYLTGLPARPGTRR